MSRKTSRAAVELKAAVEDAASPITYRRGFNQPMGPFPFLARAWFANATRPAICGVAALVPPTGNQPIPFAFGNAVIHTRTPPFTAAFQDTSGTPRTFLPMTPAWTFCQEGAG